MRIDITKERCSGCKLCQQICAIAHFEELNPKKAAIVIKARFPSPGIFEPVLCDQCGECAQVCPAGAIANRAGVYVIDPELCSGCEECLAACPSDAIHLPVNSAVPVKCDLCLACTAVCNTGALVALASASEPKEPDECTDSVARLSA
jgi:carbon-monoxide dehydrogenase iron sulfur subunit